MIDAIAAMLAAPKAAKEKTPADKLVFSPGEFYAVLKERAGHIVLCEPVESRLFGQLGRKLQQTSGLEREDLDRIVSWIEAGGLRNWPGGQPTFEHAVKHFGKWLTYAREWERRGRQTIGGGRGSSVDVSGDFK